MCKCRSRFHVAGKTPTSLNVSTVVVGEKDISKGYFGEVAHVACRELLANAVLLLDNAVLLLDKAGRLMRTISVPEMRSGTNSVTINCRNDAIPACCAQPVVQMAGWVWLRW